MRQDLTDAQLDAELPSMQRRAWRWEQQPVYDVGNEHRNLQAFLAGAPRPPSDDPALGAWMRLVHRLVHEEGKTVARVRVVDEPMTDYQRWLCWTARWNREAGEVIDCLPRAELRRVRRELLAFSPAADWWLLDAGTSVARLVIMHFDERGRLMRSQLSVEPDELAAAEAWSELVTPAARAAGVVTGPAEAGNPSARGRAARRGRSTGVAA